LSLSPLTIRYVLYVEIGSASVSEVKLPAECAHGWPLYMAAKDIVSECGCDSFRYLLTIPFYRLTLANCCITTKLTLRTV